MCILIVLRKTSQVRLTDIWDGVEDVLLREARRRCQCWKVMKLDPATVDVSTQIQVFSRADVVVGVHGAGLANALWCRTGTHLCEIVPINPPPIRYLFWNLSTSLRLVYHPFHVLSASWNDSFINGPDPESVASWIISRCIV